MQSRAFRPITAASYKRWKAPLPPCLTDTPAPGRDFHPRYIQILLWPSTGDRLFTRRPLTSVFSLLKFISNPKTEPPPPRGAARIILPSPDNVFFWCAPFVSDVAGGYPAHPRRPLGMSLHVSMTTIREFDRVMVGGGVMVNWLISVIILGTVIYFLFKSFIL